MSKATEVIANCIEHDYNRTFHDTAVCILADLRRAGYAVVELTPEETVERFRSWVARNGHYKCTCGETLADHYVDLRACATNVECHGFNLDRDPLVNKFSPAQRMVISTTND